MIGRTFSHYRILDKLGGGGMGEVYLAEDTVLRREVAIKVLPPEMAADPERLERFAREATAVGALNHPNIVTIHAIEEVDGLKLLVMERVRGRTLAELLPEGGFDSETFFDLAVPLADALSAAHERGITHRDLKPGNVMVTDDGRVKIVDFGLAKLREEVGAGDETALASRTLTEAGRVLGTFPYMSPEQVKGKAVDSRSDLFSLGVVLYEMATGERPFAGETSADLVSSILRDTPPPVPEIRQEMPRHLGRIISHCLEKNPEERFQTAKDLRNELVSLKREMESEKILQTGAGWADPRRSRRRGLRPVLAAGAALLLLGLLGAAGVWLWRGGEEPGEPVRAEAAVERPSLAVLYFQNLTADPDVDWLRTGLTDMLVTDLSQSPELQILSTDRLYQILKDLDRVEERMHSAETIQRLADRAGVETVLLGSYAKVGETLRIDIKLQDADSGRILVAERAEGQGEASLFTLVDDLSRTVRRRFEPAGPARPEVDRDLEAVTTSSVEAYRYYSEAMNLRHQLKLEEAVTLFERAVEVDPGFAMAHARLSAIHETLGHSRATYEHAREAFDNAERLPPRERHFLEGQFHSRRREGYGRAIDAYRRALELYPDHDEARYYLGHVYSYLELFDDAIAQYRELLPRTEVFPGTFHALAHMHAAKGELSEGVRYVEELRRREPDNWWSHVAYGWHLIDWGRLDQAREAYRRGEELRPGSPWVDLGRWRMSVLREDWPVAAAAAEALISSDDATWRWQGLVNLARVRLYQGSSRQAVELYRQAFAVFQEGDPQAAASRCWLADLLLQLDRPREALAEAEEARRQAPGDWPQWEGLFWSALARQALGGAGEADRLASELEPKVGLLPGQVETRLARHLAGRLSLARGEVGAARRELAAARALLPARGLPWHRHRLPDHALVWDALGAAAAASGDTAEAVRWYRTLADSGAEHIELPVLYVRSFYRLAKLHEARGETDQAREAYRRFARLWADGDLDREQVREALAKSR